MRTQIPRTIAQKHWQEWTEGSGVSPDITALNLQSLSDPQEIARRLGWQYYAHTPGWWVGGIDPRSGEPRIFGQFKPDTPIQFPDSDKPAKYLSGPKGQPTEAIFLKHPDSNYWQKLLADPAAPVVIAEGTKKAGASLATGVPAVALAGVWNGQINKRKLAPDLELLAQPGRPICLCFDSDAMTKPGVQQALALQGKLFKQAGCTVTIAQLPLETKGLDDFVLMYGEQGYRKLVQSAAPYQDWLEGLEGQFPGKSSKGRGKGQDDTPKASVVARALAENYRQRLAWNDEAGAWYCYEAKHSGIWSAESDRAVESVIAAELDSSIPDGYNLGYLRSVSGLLQRYLLVKRWDQQPGLLPLQNGVLELATNKFLDHAPGYQLTWQLPYSYNPVATCQPVQDWMLAAVGGDDQLMQLLRGYLKAIVTSRVDLQRYVECLGPAGTGKSTYQRLAIALVGLENTVSVELKHLEGSRFEVAEVYGKKLILINDSERYGGSVNNLKALTGGDRLRAERKNVQGTQGFFASGMVLVASNESVQTSDCTSGLERRRLTIPFLNQVAPDQRRDLITITESGASGDFAEYLPGLLNWVLAMPDEDVTRFVLDTSANVPGLSRWKAESLIESNPIAEWLDARIVADPGAKTYVGVAKRVRVSSGTPGNSSSREIYENVDSWLYASYVSYCQSTGSKSVSSRRFSNLLDDLCKNQLHLEVARGRDESGSHFCGLAIRDSIAYANWPRPITGDMGSPPESNPPPCEPPPDPNLTDGLTHPDGFLTAGSTQTDGSDGSDGLFENGSNKSKTSSQNKLQPETDVEFGDNPSVPSESVSTNGSSRQPTHQAPPSNPSAAPVVVEVLQQLPKSRFNPSSRRLEVQYRVRLSSGATAIVFEAELPNGIQGTARET